MSSGGNGLCKYLRIESCKRPNWSHFNQPNQKNVWFTAGPLSGSAERTCKIPAGKAIFLGDGIECSTIENPEAKTDAQLKKCATDAMQTFRDPASLKATIDGVPLKNLSQYRVKSEAFDVNFPAHNIWGVKSGSTRSAG